MRLIALVIMVFVLVAAAVFFGSRPSEAPVEPSPVPTMLIEPQNNESSGSSASQAAATIRMTDEGYAPKEVSISVGETIQFANESSDARWPASNIHPTHEIYPEFDPKQPISSGQSWSFTFDRAGQWRFHDHLWPSMTGTIRVE